MSKVSVDWSSRKQILRMTQELDEMRMSISAGNLKKFQAAREVMGLIQESIELLLELLFVTRDHTRENGQS